MNGMLSIHTQLKRLIASTLALLLLVMPMLAPSYAMAIDLSRSVASEMAADHPGHHDGMDHATMVHGLDGDSPSMTMSDCETGCNDCSLGCCPGATAITLPSLASPYIYSTVGYRAVADSLSGVELTLDNPPRYTYNPQRGRRRRPASLLCSAPLRPL